MEEARQDQAVLLASTTPNLLWPHHALNGLKPAERPLAARRQPGHAQVMLTDYCSLPEQDRTEPCGCQGCVCLCKVGLARPALLIAMRPTSTCTILTNASSSACNLQGRRWTRARNRCK